MGHDFIGERIGSYLLLAPIAVGQFAAVYQAKDTRSGHLFALKLLDLAGVRQTQHSKRIAQELNLALSLRHAHILPILDHGKAGTYRYFVMELMRHGTLQQFLARHRVGGTPLPVPLVLALGIQLCDALHYAHTHHVIHRDVKPSNILLNNDEALYVRLGDFGMALLVQPFEQRTRTGKTVGALEYLAPEQAQGLDIDGRADDYAVASILYELLSLRPPFAGSSALAIEVAKLKEPPIPLQQLNPLVPPAVGKVIEKALQRLPDHRYFSSEVFATALGSCLAQIDAQVAHLYQQGANIWNLPSIALPTIIKERRKGS